MCEALKWLTNFATGTPIRVTIRSKNEFLLLKYKQALCWKLFLVNSMIWFHWMVFSGFERGTIFLSDSNWEN